MPRPDHCPNCGSGAITAHTGSYCEECGEPLRAEPRRADLPPVAMNIWERLRGLVRTAEQDAMVRRLLYAGMQITMIDCAVPARKKKPLEHAILFRDKTGTRWVVKSDGTLKMPGSTEWQVIP